jgi:hypothetical protein
MDKIKKKELGSFISPEMFSQDKELNFRVIKYNF